MFQALIVLLFLLISLPAHAQEASPYCAALNDNKTYKDHESYRYLVLGKEGWVFRSRKDLKQDFTLTPSTIQKFSKINKLLKSQGKTLHIIMAPTRGILSANKIPMESQWIKSFDSSKAKNTFNGSLNALRLEGLSIADLTSIPSTISDVFYYKRDHHWTTMGAKYSAEKTAELIIPTLTNDQKQKFKTENKNITIEIEGSFGQFIERLCHSKILDEIAPTIQTYTEEKSDLFADNNNTSIALIGTSNTTEPAPSFANFAGYMRELTQSDVENLSVQGAGIASPILSYFGSNNPNKANHKHLIWELASHYDFNGKEFAPIFKQLIPAAAGVCDGKEVIKSIRDVDDKKITLFSAEENNINTQNKYAYFKFDMPTKKDFAFTMKFTDGKSQRFRFKREKRYPHDGVYFLDLNDYDNKEISEMSLLFDKNFKAKSLNFKICNYPTI